MAGEPQRIAEEIAGKKTDKDVWGEAVQVAVMAMRVAVESDASLTVEYHEP